MLNKNRNKVLPINNCCNVKKRGGTEPNMAMAPPDALEEVVPVKSSLEVPILTTPSKYHNKTATKSDEKEEIAMVGRSIHRT